ncbi:MAG: PTS sugar transporter subunit IIA [Spirochaetae bacterium HGW-Spirochaetae-1]|jgi:fructose-specific phosphotransferase system IIA component|nr:MAG: PTS sugar transporter subunit IIA [Spirochaetae bacterium HGW-Spirochaetae-1]
MVLAESLKKINILVKARSKNKWELIDEMVDLAVKNREISSADSEEIKMALVEREKSMSTGIGNGVAIPHCTTARVSDIIIILAISQKGIDFDSIDNNPVRIVILLLVPKNKLSQHIKSLANIAKVMGDEELREKIASLKTAESILKTIKNFKINK